MWLVRVESLFACLLMLPVGAYPQVPSVKEDTPISVGASNRFWNEVVHNQGTSSLEAAFSSFSCSNRGGLTGVVFDSRFNYSGNRPIPPDGRAVFSADDPSDCRGGVTAVVYSDGHVEGSYRELRQIFSRRRAAYEALGAVIPLVNEVADGQRTTPQLLNTLQSLLTQELSSRNPLPEVDGYNFIYVVVRESWKQSGELLVSSDDTPSKGPDVDEVMKTQRVSLEQARAIVLSRKLREWRSVLEGHTEMP